MSIGGSIVDAMRRNLQRKPNWTREEVMDELHNARAEVAASRGEGSRTGRGFACDCAIPDIRDSWCRNCGGSP